MTNKEALVKGVLSGLPVDDFQADKVLLDADIDGTAAYSTDDKEAIDKCAIPILQGLYIDSISEGGYSVKFSRDAIALKLQKLGELYGLADLVPVPKITSRKVW